MKRRGLIGGAIAAALTAAGALGKRVKQQGNALTLRPPGALPGEQFESACARCFKCGSACQNGCIKFHGLSAGLDKAFTPYIVARERGCTLCGECGKACPTGALQPFGDSKPEWKSSVKMGKAYVNKSLCYSFAGRTCGACYRACPLAGEAIKIGMFETPLLNPEHCVGCGLCEQSCLHLPQAIRVIPAEVMEEEEA